MILVIYGLELLYFRSIPEVNTEFHIFCIVLKCKLVFYDANLDSETLAMIDNSEGSFSEIVFVFCNYFILLPILGKVSCIFYY